MDPNSCVKMFPRNWRRWRLDRVLLVCLRRGGFANAFVGRNFTRPLTLKTSIMNSKISLDSIKTGNPPTKKLSLTKPKPMISKSYIWLIFISISTTLKNPPLSATSQSAVISKMVSHKLNQSKQSLTEASSVILPSSFWIRLLIISKKTSMKSMWSS